MAGQTRAATLKENGNHRSESVNELLIDLDLSDADELSDSKNDEKIIFAKSTDVRRRIEEKLEVRLLKDELSIDNLDL